MSKKKKIKIFCVPSHQTEDRTSGVDFARIIQPMKHLNGFKLEDVEFETHVFHPTTDKDMVWDKVAKEFDMVYLNYTAMPMEFAKMGLMFRKEGKPIILDLDDSLWDISDDNPAYKIYKSGSDGIRNFTAIANEVDYITCTNGYLRNVIDYHTNKKDITVFPNYIDFKIYKHRCKFKDTHEITLLHFGSTTHFKDLMTEPFGKGIDRIMKRYPNVKFKTIGANLIKYKERWGARYEEGFGHVDIYKWISDKFPDLLDGADICVIPLEANPYTICKSDIKRSEMSSAIKPIVAQKIRQYKNSITHGVDGYLAKTEDDWFYAIARLIDDKKHRKEVAQRGFERVRDTKQMKDHILEYAEFFKRVSDDYEPQEIYKTHTLTKKSK